MLSRAVVSQADKPTAGFTIIEALVALAVVAISIAAIGSLMASTARGTRQLEQHVALVQVANNVMWLNLPSRSEPAPENLAGETMKHPWREKIEPFVEINAPAGDVKWVPERVRLQVRSPFGSVINMETVRLFRKTSQ
jgi:general secretion pathway protein I